MYMSGDLALVRYYFTMGPRRQAEQTGRWWPELGYKYLLALRKGFKVRAIPLGWAHFQLLHLKRWRHWQRVYDAFGCELVERPVNVVCAPFGLQLGIRLTAKDVAPQELDGVPDFLLKSGASDEVVYEPEPVLTACWTASLRNIAIVGTKPSAPTAGEIQSLKLYDTVVTPTEAEAAELRGQGVRCQAYTPRQMADDALALGLLLRGESDA